MRTRTLRIVTIALSISRTYNSFQAVDAGATIKWQQAGKLVGNSDNTGKAVDNTTTVPPANAHAVTDGLMQVEVQKHWAGGAKAKTGRGASGSDSEKFEPGLAAKVMATPTAGGAAKDTPPVSPELRAHSSYSVGDLLYREEQVLSGAGETWSGTKERAKEAAHNWPITGLELVSGVAIGSLMVLASRNPALALPIKILNRSMLTVAAADLVGKVAIPSVDALVHPERTEADKHAVGRNLGAAVFDYSMAAVAGGAGSRAAAPLIERTQFGSMIQGYDYLKTPGGAEMRIFKSGNALISKNGMRTFQTAPDLDAITQPGGSGIVGDNDLLRRTYNESTPANATAWRSGKEVTESAGKFGTWFETFAGALASEITERTADIGIGLIEHEYLVKQLDGGVPDDLNPEKQKPGSDKK